MSGGPAVREEAREVLQASLILSIMQHNRGGGGGPVSRGDEPARPEDVVASSSRARPPQPPRHRSDPPVVRRVSALIDSIGECRGPFEKLVTVSDTRDQQNRLILRKDDVKEYVLPLLGEGDSTERGVEVMTFNTEGEAFPMQFKFWSRKVFVLMGNWKAFVRANQFKDSDVLKLWVFRDVRTRGLCFLISVRRSNAAGQSRTEKGTRTKGRELVESKPL